MYTQDMLESIKKVEATRAERLAKVKAGENPRRMTAEEKDAVLAAFHPDYITSQFETLKMGPNKGEKVPLELAAILQANSRINPADIDLSNPDYDVDVLIIGGGGAGSAAAIMANENGANAMIVTKLRHGTEMEKAHLICHTGEGFKSYIPLEADYMVRNGNQYTLHLKGKSVTVTVTGN